MVLSVQASYAVAVINLEQPNTLDVSGLLPRLT